VFATGQILVLSILIIVLGFDGTHGGHVPCGVTAHGSPGGPLQFDRLEAALGDQVPLKRHAPGAPPGVIDCTKGTPCQTTPIKEPPSSTTSLRTLIARRLYIMARKITRLRTSTRKRRWNTRIRPTNGQRKPSRNQPTPPFEMTCPRNFSHLIRGSG
jgi:hypothetical protein